MSSDRLVALPTLVGERPVLSARQPRAKLGLAALALGPADRWLLQVIGEHPFLTVAELAAVLGVIPSHARACRRRLVDLGLVRLLGTEEVGTGKAGAKLAELTLPGLRLVAANVGLPLGQAVEIHGLVGGGPDYPLGTRHNLVRNLDHTLGVNRAFANLHRAAKLIGAGFDGGATIVRWDNAAVCARGRCRPDGYGIYRLGVQHYPFFLEYDRGTMSARDYRHKFSAYERYRRFRQTHYPEDHFPEVLVVAASAPAEERIAGTLRSHGYDDLPVNLATETQGQQSANRDGLLGPVWRLPHESSHNRHRWPQGP